MMIYPDGKDPNDSHMKGIKPHVASQSGSAGCDVWYREAGLTARFVIKFSGHTILTDAKDGERPEQSETLDETAHVITSASKNLASGVRSADCG